MYVSRILFLIIGTLLAAAVPFETVLAGGDALKGRAFAEKNCGKCHALDIEGESPLEQAPAFRTFGEKWPVESLAESLAEGIVTGHADMPEFVLSPDEIGDFLGYLRSLQPGVEPGSQQPE